LFFLSVSYNWLSGFAPLTKPSCSRYGRARSYAKARQTGNSSRSVPIIILGARFIFFAFSATFLQAGMSNVEITKNKFVMITNVLTPAVIFFAIYHIIKIFTDYMLRRKIIKAGHIDKAGILEQKPVLKDQPDRYPSLKWGLVALMGGLGLILIEILRSIHPSLVNYHDATLPLGILLVFVSLGFLIYFLIMHNRKKG
jgi:hypothetical protein